MNKTLWPVLAAACMLNAACAQVPSRQWLAIANDHKVELKGGNVVVRAGDVQDSVTVFDVSASPAKLVARVDAGASVVGPPQSIALSPDLSLAIVTAATRIDPADAKKTADGNQLAVIDLQATPAAVVQTLTTGPAPAGVAIAPDGKLVLVTTRTDSAVVVYALENKRLRQTGRVALPDKSVPAGVAITPDGKQALVTRDGDSLVTVLDIQNGNVKLAGRDFTTGVRPYGVHIAPSGEWAIVGNVGRNQGDIDTVSLVDLKAPFPRSVDHAVVGRTVEGVAVSPDSKLVAAVTQDGSNRAPDWPMYKAHGRVFLLRVEGGKLVHVGEAPVGGWPQGAAFSADSKRLFVQNMVERNVHVFAVGANGLADTGERIALPGGGAAIDIGWR
jgi:DNA-binding beta-propeller fold protein YncE